MTRRTLSLGLIGALAATAMAIAPTAAEAQYYGGGDRSPPAGWQQAGWQDAGWHGRDHDGDRGGPPGDGWGRRGPPPGARGGYYEDRGDGYGRGEGYYGRRHRCHGGTGGTIIGAIAGGLLGNAVAGYGDRATGTIIGGGVGALAGNAIGRDC